MVSTARQMMYGIHHPSIRATAKAAALLMFAESAWTQPAQGQFARRPEVDNPISKAARLVNPKLAQVEDRVRWLDRELLTLARYNQFPLPYSLGYRGHRPTPESPDPAVILDLGRSYPIDGIYLVPSQREHLNDPGIFPREYRLEAAKSADFSDAQVIQVARQPKHYDSVSGMPVEFHPEVLARYVRLTVHRGHNRAASDLFGLSEFFVFSGGEPVSFQAKVRTNGDLNIDKVWHPEALTDGRTPLGIWHHGEASQQHFGDAVIAGQDNPQTTWLVNLAQESEIDRIVLYPYQVQQTQDISIFPQSMKIEITSGEQPGPRAIVEWSNPLPGTNHMVPLVFNLDAIRAKTIRVTAIEPWVMGHRRMHALSEIEVWSGGRNLIAGSEVLRQHGEESIPVRSLTDGFSSERRISPIHVWLDQLARRDDIERELSVLRDIYTQLASRSELNVSWGSAVILGLTFLIPVFVFERKRMQSKEHLDIIRKRIASDLHDDIGSNLGSISLIARTARKDLARLHGPPELDEDLGEVEMIARESSLAMRDIVWLLERKQDSIGDLVHRMRETAGRLLREIDFTLECTSTRTAARLTLDAKRHLFLFYKEAIHNVVKHSKARNVSIRLWDEGEQLGMEVIDDGIGLPVNRDRVSISVKKLQDRADVMGGILQVTSSAETGTCIRMLVKRSHLTTQPKTS